MSAGTSPRSISIASARCSAASSSDTRSAGAWSSIGATSPIAGTARSASATASCALGDGLAVLDPALESAAARRGAGRSGGAHPDAVADVFIDLETTGSQRGRRHGGVPRRAWLLRPRRVPGPPVPAHQPCRRTGAARRGRRSASRVSDLLVSYNGKTFDVPVMETRWVFHRMELPFDGIPHFDMLHPARRLWKLRASASTADRTMAGAGCRRWSGRCSTCGGWAMCPAARFRGASSSSCEAAIHVRSSRCSSTTGSISCRWRPSPPGPSVSPKKASTPVATRMRHWPWAASTSAAATRSRGRSVAIGGRAGAEMSMCGERRCIGLGLRCRRERRCSRRRRRSGGSCSRSANPVRLGQPDGRRPPPVRGRGARRSTRSTGLATTLRRGSLRCLRWRRLARPPARRPGAAKKVCGTGWRVSIRKSPESGQKPPLLDVRLSFWTGLLGGCGRHFLRLAGLDRLRLLPALGGLGAEPLGEPFHAALGVDQLLTAGEERVAVVADFEVQLGLGRPRLPGRPARAARLDLVVLRDESLPSRCAPWGLRQRTSLPEFCLARDFLLPVHCPVPPVAFQLCHKCLATEARHRWPRCSPRRAASSACRE